MSATGPTSKDPFPTGGGPTSVPSERADRPAPLPTRIIPAVSDVPSDKDFRRAVEPKVTGNIRNKLLGTTGATIVARHSGVTDDTKTIKAATVIRELQSDLARTFGRLTTTLPEGTIPKEVAEDPKRESIHALERHHEGSPKYMKVKHEKGKTDYQVAEPDDKGIVLVRELHTTVISQHVVDTDRGKEGWDDKVDVAKFYRAFYHFQETLPEGMIISTPDHEYTTMQFLEEIAKCNNEAEVMTLLSSSDLSADQKHRIRELSTVPLKTDPKELEEIKPITLKATEIKVTDNGSVVVQWAPSPDLAKLRHSLLDYGAVGKRGLDSPYTATTLGFFPNYHLMSASERTEVAHALERFASAHAREPLEITIDPKNLSTVRFERNDLSRHHAQFQPLIDTDKKIVRVSTEFFPQSSPRTR